MANDRTECLFWFAGDIIDQMLGDQFALFEKHVAICDDFLGVEIKCRVGR